VRLGFGSRFLRDPGLFPARLAGQAWGHRSVAVDFAGGPYVVRGLSAEQEAGARERFADFRVETPASREPVECCVFRAATDEFRPVDPRGFELTLDLDHERHAVHVAGPGLMARLEWRPALAAGVWTASPGDDSFPGALENVLRVLTAYRLVEEGGALLHSAGIVADGGAWIFVGRSGSGKTTLSRLSLAEGRVVLSDDLNAVLPSAEGHVVAPVPFAGDHRGSWRRVLPLTAVCQLRQGERHAISPLSSAEGLAALVAAAPYVNQDPHRIDRLLANLEGIAESSPVRRLTFAMAGGVWAMLAEGHEALA
jgi:hypothetical protein